ncbi:dnaJ homolog subfamily C member 27, partial [Corapipo altera]|uniref:dnaJ homolog subfamily C member 27 n=1 Tax=Corapipo altera TaxID=415028 RepID=UPI000FD6B1CF
MEPNAPKRKEPRKSLRVKVISMGNAEVGKSCIIKRYCEKRFVSKYLATIGIDYGVTKVQIRDREIKVNIFDMAGHPFFYEVRPPLPTWEPLESLSIPKIRLGSGLGPRKLGNLFRRGGLEFWNGL